MIHQWPKAFSKLFVNDYWEQEPGVFTYPSEHWLITLPELFSAVCNMPEWGSSDRFWILKSKQAIHHSDFRMERGNGLNLFGPKTNDNNFEGFFERMNGRMFGINIHGLAKGFPEITQRKKEIIQSIAWPDTPELKRWVTDTFFGTYTVTPFGIHRDAASVIALCLAGERTYYTWQENYFSPDDPALHKPDIKCIMQHAPNAEKFTVTAGQLFYWPSNRWHVATSNGKPSVVAQLSAYFNPNELNRQKN